MLVELLHHPGCRSARLVHLLIQDCLAVLAIDTPVHVRIGAYASPTVLLDGIDVMDPCRGTPSGQVCRLDLPTRERLLAALVGAAPAAASRTTGTESLGAPVKGIAAGDS